MINVSGSLLRALVSYTMLSIQFQMIDTPEDAHKIIIIKHKYRPVLYKVRLNRAVWCRRAKG